MLFREGTFEADFVGLSFSRSSSSQKDELLTENRADLIALATNAHCEPCVDKDGLRGGQNSELVADLTALAVSAS